MDRKALSKTFIPFHEWEGIGGPYTFMDNLRREFDRRGIALCRTFQDCDQMLFPISYDLDKLHWGKVRGKRFIVRLDGIYYPQKHGDEYRTRNQTIKEIYRQYADLVIFQSDYCRKQCFEMLGEKSADQYRIIVNGADQSLFYPGTRNQLSDPVKFITTGNFRDAAMIEPLVAALDALQADFTLQVVGPITAELQPWLDRDYIVHEGEKTVAQTADLLRAADIFLYSHLNPPCPNSVIEAVSCGLPVVGFDSGAMSELLPWSTELLAPVNDNTFHRYEDFDATLLRQKIELSINEYSRFKGIAIEHAKDYPFSECADQYIQAIADTYSQGVAAPQSKAASWVHGRIGRFAMKCAKRLKLDAPLRSAALELLASSRREEFSGFMMQALEDRVGRLSPSEALKASFEFDKRVYELEGQQAIEYDDGVHTKHRHMNYHAFFVHNVLPTDRVLDLGCGKGELANSIAGAVPSGSVHGIDYRQTSINKATAAFGDRKNLMFVHGDITKDLPPGTTFDVVVLSNVLEHIDRRVELLRQCIELFSPRQFLIRVPMYQRDWRVPLMDELGFDYRLDPEHFIEFSPETFAAEMDAAGLNVAHAEYRWGEIWSRLEPK